MNLNDMIKYDDESTTLDFKKEGYRKEENAELLKDVMSMANALTDDTKRIIIGVKKTSTDRSFNNLDVIEDVAVYENLVQENIEPNITFDYYPYDYSDSIRLAVFEIHDNHDRPYMMRKDYGPLKKGEMWIRKGTRKSRVTRGDLDAMALPQRDTVSSNDISIVFGENNQNEIVLKRKDMSKDMLPSEIEKRRLERLLEALKKKYYDEDWNELPIEYNGGRKKDIFGLVTGARFNDSKRAICVGNSFGAYVYRNKEELLTDIENARDTYSDYDCHYMYEHCAERINFSIRNRGEKFLEDVRVHLLFDQKVFSVADRIYDDPEETNNIFSIPQIHETSYNYPRVFIKDGHFCVEVEHNQIRHKTVTELLGEDLRVLISPQFKGADTSIKYTISARNLPDIIEGSLHVRIE